MADCHDLFCKFLEEIRLSDSKKDSLRTSRNANRNRIKAHFHVVLKKEEPECYGQGSYSMHTMVNPLDGDFDIDDGVYLQGLGTDPSKFPSCETVHGWIIDATKGYTKVPPERRSNCVRVRYADDYHVDLPCYAENAEGVPMLFRKGKNPVESSPREFSDWFKDKVNADGVQLRYVIRYLKAWRDHQGGDALLASGLGLTILASDNFIADDCDDVAFVKTATRIHSHMNAGGNIIKPVRPYEHLDEGWTQNQRDNYIKKLKALMDRGSDALEEESRTVASGIWKQIFGSRFPIVEEAKKLVTPAPAILGNDGRSG